ncbi:MAG: hypothetical protein M1819_004297 [Sarea resinae]|nr:MAG: hypothetical protein M1819_004297 [Sarea resinae]
MAQQKLDLSKLSARDQQELQQFVVNESQKARIQGSVHALTEVCWKKCTAANKISGGNLSSAEESCTANCVDRFMDANLSVLKHLEKLRVGAA